jgi:hypothetical protein
VIPPSPSAATRDRRKTLASGVILLVIGLHAIPVVHAGERDTLWPFMVWAMYKHSRPAGPVEANQRRILAVTASGARDTVTPHLLGQSITVLDQRYHRPLMGGDTTAAIRLFERLNRGRSDPYVTLLLESETYTVTDTGLARRENPVATFRAPEVGH